MNCSEFGTRRTGYMSPLNTQVIKDEAPSEISGNRRSKQRFPIDLPLTYKILKNYLITGTGSGTTLDMSSGGLAFTADKTFKIRTHIELSISWPVLLNGNCPMKLVVEGCVVRSDGQSTAIRMEHYEFRTQRRSAAQPEAVLAMAAGWRN
jgi:c-di-GMP-binding flagellar brake protein YcgR